MYRLIFLLSFLFMSVAFTQKKADDIRILNLLPYFVQPPLVDPCLPEDFLLGQQEEDPYFSEGYHWGSQGTLRDYFEDTETLKGCLIRAQVSTTVKQLGHNRFSNDGNTQDLSAAGFTEIKVNKGRWGIFPYRELLAKGPKGRRYYQMWVGLNTHEGATLYFQFIYPEYLSEPTHTQKTIWSNFVKKTDLLSMNDLLLARGITMNSEITADEGIEQEIGLRIEKRRWDQKFFILAENVQKFSIESFEEMSFLTNFSLGQSFVEIHALLGVNEREVSHEKLRSPFQVVDQFSFEPQMLHIKRFTEKGNLLLFY